MRYLGVAILGLGLSLSQSAWADFFVHSWENHHQGADECLFTPTFRYYTTTQNFNANSSSSSVSGLTRYDREEVDVDAQCGLTDRFSLFGRVAWTRADIQSQSNDSADYGLADQTLGLNFRLTSPGSVGVQPAVDLQVQLDIPAYSNSASAQMSPYLGDQTLDGTFGIFGTLPLFETDSGNFLSVSGVGFTARSKGYSSALPWSAWLEYQRKDRGDNAGLWGRAGLFGMRSFNNDSSTGLRSSAGSGGSDFIGATNPTLINVGGELGYRLALNTSLIAGAADSIAGTNAPSGLIIYAGFSLRLGHVESGDPLSLTPAEYGKSNAGLVHYTSPSHVTSVNDRLNLVKIDKGLNEGVEVGQTYDIFSVTPQGEELEAVARAKVTSVRSTESALKISEYYKESVINTGWIAKRVVE